MKTSEQLHAGVRFLVAGLGSLLLLIWTLMGRGLPPLIIPPGSSISPGPVLFTAFLAATILVILSPMVIRGSGGDRWLSVLLGAFPFAVLSVVVLWVLEVIR